MGGTEISVAPLELQLEAEGAGGGGGEHHGAHDGKSGTRRHHVEAGHRSGAGVVGVVVGEDANKGVFGKALRQTAAELPNVVVDGVALARFDLEALVGDGFVGGVGSHAHLGSEGEAVEQGGVNLVVVNADTGGTVEKRSIRHDHSLDSFADLLRTFRNTESKQILPIPVLEQALQRD